MVRVVALVIATLMLSACNSEKKAEGGRGGGGGGGQIRTACQAEIQKFCNGQERPGRCLRDRNSAEMSETCRVALSKRQDRD